MASRVKISLAMYRSVRLELGGERFRSWWYLTMLTFEQIWHTCCPITRHTGLQLAPVDDQVSNRSQLPTDWRVVISERCTRVFPQFIKASARTGVSKYPCKGRYIQHSGYSSHYMFLLCSHSRESAADIWNNDSCLTESLSLLRLP
jgi:hypothetical protein